MYLGIDLGGTNIAVGVVDENYHIIGKSSIPTQSPRPAEGICDSMAQAVQLALKDAGVELNEIKWAGIGTPGTVNYDTGVLEYANNLKLNNVPMKKMMEDRIGIATYLENDANAAAYGEFLAGAAKGCRHAVAVTLGTGVGGGVIIDGKIYTGYNFGGAELGHMVIDRGGKLCTCGRKGCFEAYCSATALIDKTKEYMNVYADSKLWDAAGGSLENVNGKTAFDAMRMGDQKAAEIVHDYIEYLGLGLTNLINIFQPEVLCIGGGICKEGDTLLVPLNKIIEEERYTRNSDRQTKLMIAQLGNNAGIIGAAFLGNIYGK